MDDSEKVRELKKAYADMLLNTTEESAARVMASERKVTRLQQELVYTKEEAIRILVRLKQMLDYKVNEALSQQKKIDELEAQLQEAEEIVIDLRAELSGMQAMLEKVTNNKMHSPDEDHVKNENLVRVDEGKEVPVTTNPKADIICEREDKPDEVKVVSEVADHVKETNKASQFSGTKGSPCILDTNAPSRRKRKNSSIMVCTNEVQKDPVSPSFPKVSTDATKIVEQSGSPCVLDTNAPSRKKRKNSSIMECENEAEKKDPVSPSFPKVSTDATTIVEQSGSPCVLDTNAPSRKKRKNSSIMVCENEVQKDPVSPFSKVSTDATAMVDQSRSHNVQQNETLVRRDEGKAVLFVKTNPLKADIICETDKAEELLDKSDLTRQRSLSTENNLDVPACKADVEAANESTDKLDPKVSYLDDKVSSRSANYKFFKYTYHRKRKKEAISVPDTNCSLETRSFKKICGEKQNGYAEPHKPCTMTQSTRDSD